MSIDALEKFYQHVQNNAALESEATAALQEGAAAVVTLAEREGFSFTSEELSIALAHHAASNDELSDEELELVAGGFIMAPRATAPKGSKGAFG